MLMPPRFLSVILCALGAMGAGAYWLWQEPEQTQAQAQPGPVLAVFGPGLIAAPQRSEDSPWISDVALSLTDEGDLLIDPALLHFFHQHLVEHAGPAAWENTEHDLRSKLAGKALAQALEIARSYQRYISDYDSLLAAQNLNGTADLVRLRGWAQQRHLLRQRIFGDAIALAWFDNDEANLDTALTELEQHAAGTVPQETATDPRYGPNAQDKHHMAAAHAAHLQQTVQDATRSAAQSLPD